MLNKNQSNKRNYWKYALVLPLLGAFVFFFQVKVIAQEKEQSSISKNVSSNNIIYMNWDKDTKDEELKSDVSALKAKGITIKYSKLKRNENGEIIAIKVKFDDGKGNSGATEFNSSKPIKPITFYKTEDEIGFGKPKPSHSKINKNVEKKIEISLNSKDSISKDAAYNVTIKDLKDPNVKSEKSIIIKKNGQEKPTIIVDGKIMDDNITIEELDIDPNAIQKIIINKDGLYGKNGAIVISTKDINNAMRIAKKEIEKLGPVIEKSVRIELEKAQPEIERAIRELNFTTPEIEKAQEEMIKAKNEMIKAKNEMEKTKAELEKSKAELKTQKK